MKAEKATGEYNLLIREAFHSHDMMPVTSDGQPPVAPKQSGSQRSTRSQLSITAGAFKLPIALMATSSHKQCAHALTIIHTPTKYRPLTLVEPHTPFPRAEPFTRSHSSSKSSHPQEHSAKRLVPSARLHEIENGAAAVVPNGRWYSRIGRTTVRTSWSTSRPRPPRCLLPT